VHVRNDGKNEPDCDLFEIFLDCIMIRIVLAATHTVFSGQNCMNSAILDKGLE